MTPPATHCHETGKRIYVSRDQARRAMRHLSARLRVYECPFCGKHHLTKEKNTKRAGVK